MTTETELMDSIDARVMAHRTSEVELCISTADGRPLVGADVEVSLVRHAFKIGANAFNVLGIDDPGLRSAYRQRFRDLCNYATLPFYWSGYEKEPGVENQSHLDALASWCIDNDIVCKGHPLVWHETFPKWADAFDDTEVLARLQRRVREIVARFAGRIDVWDVVNEATVSHRHENAIGRWIARSGPSDAVRTALGWARQAGRTATLLYNDFNISSEYEALARDLSSAGAVDAFGIQSHMHVEPWSLERAWRVCETYAAFERPLHFTELTVLSGRPKARDDKDWHRVRTDWHSTPEGEAMQAEYGERLYSLLFSHPAVHAITWWDFSDHRAWQGAPAGLLRADMTPKPLYERLSRLFQQRWTTHARVSTPESGRVRVRCFHGHCRADIHVASGATSVSAFEVKPGTECVAIVVA